ncbi:hypothetical protein [Methanosarcina horonobensis]|uniref:hypothetical protein n=1 Tax=Methanosarcina horonobensis TaxID=418008 RepID=UPI0022B8944F|nr:hypothetical protein [Methanosarcina horonobensis]
MGDRTDTADPRGNLRNLVHRLTYSELLNTPDRGDGEPVSSLDDTLVIHLQSELGMAFMSRGWRDLYDFCQWYCLIFDSMFLHFPFSESHDYSGIILHSDILVQTRF